MQVTKQEMTMSHERPEYKRAETGAIPVRAICSGLRGARQ